LFKEIFVILEKEFKVEYRQKYAIGSILLYVFAAVYIVYTAITRLPNEIWHAQYWIIVLFAAMNAVLKSFVQDTPSRQLYLYTLLSPYSVILAKMLYNGVVLILLCILCFGTMTLFTGSPTKDFGLFTLSIFLGSFGLATTLTFIASVAAKGNNQSTLMAILGFPVIIPVLLIVLKMTAQANGIVADDSLISDIQILIGFNFLLVGLALFLFPFVWKD
jgi:heme exporter protein B